MLPASKQILKVLFIGLFIIFSNHMKTRNMHAGELRDASPPFSFFPAVAENMHPNLPVVFIRKMSGFLRLAESNVVTLIDFSLPSTAKRLWTIDMQSGDVLYNSFVAHGKNSGENYAEHFSNRPQSYQSSLGFYLTGEPYTGKHGNSLRLHGLERNVNDKAYERAIVIHGADYAEEAFIRQHGRLGRSHGCPALPRSLTDDFINTVKDGTLLFIYHPHYESLLCAHE